MVCTICHEIFQSNNNVYSTTCGHIFHYECLMAWLNRSYLCPQCRNKNFEVHKLYLNTNEIISSSSTTGAGVSHVDLAEKIKLKDEQIASMEEDAIINESILEHRIIELEQICAELQLVVEQLRTEKEEDGKIKTANKLKLLIMESDYELTLESLKHKKKMESMLIRKLQIAKASDLMKKMEICSLKKAISEKDEDMKEKEQLRDDKVHLQELLNQTMELYRSNTTVLQYAKVLKTYGYKNVYCCNSVIYARINRETRPEKIYNKRQVDILIEKAKTNITFDKTVH